MSTQSLNITQPITDDLIIKMSKKLTAKESYGIGDGIDYRDYFLLKEYDRMLTKEHCRCNEIAKKQIQKIKIKIS